jgi:hypothetical protein
MATVAYQAMKDFAKGWERIFRSAVCSGVAGDRRHQKAGGYHIGRRYQSGSNYSVVRPDDRRGCGPDDGSSAVDITMNRRDMILATTRLRSAYNNTKDPRRKYLNAFNGWVGSGAATRYDVYARRTKSASSDHKWHVHLEQRRRWIKDATSNAAILSILRGESVTTWLKSRGVKPAPRPAPKPAAKPAPGKPAPKPAPKPAGGLKAPPYPGRVLRRNDRAKKPDPAVKQFQQRMRERGWTSIGPADGLPGRKFETVVKAWQKHCRLPADGQIGPKTWPTPWTKPLGG